MKLSKKKFIYLIITLLCTISIFVLYYFITNTSGAQVVFTGERQIVEREKTIIRISASHSRGANTSNVINLTTFAEELNKYAGNGNATVTEKNSTTLLITFTETGNEYELSKNDGPEIPDGERYTITYDANGGSGAPASQTKKEGITLILSTTTPTRSSHTFLGWSTSSTAAEPTYLAGGDYVLDSAATLYAVWKKNITYLYNAGDQFTSITGGWAKNTSIFPGSDPSFTNWPAGVTGSVTFNPSNAYIEFSSGYGGVMMNTVNKINFADLGIDTLTFNLSTTIGGWGWDNYQWAAHLTYANWEIGIAPALSDGQAYTKYYIHDYGNWYIDGSSSTTKSESFSRTLTGLSSLSGEYYVFVGLRRSTSGTFNLTLNSIVAGTNN